MFLLDLVTKTPITIAQLKERLEELIVGGSYPFAKVEQKSYAIPENVEEKPVVWVQEQTETTVSLWVAE